MAVTSCMNRVFSVVLMTIAVMAHCSTAQTTHVVGGSTGWTLTSDPTSYSTWASQQNFTVGDSLTFNFAPSRHDVATVTQAAYDACDASSPIGPVQTASPVTIRLTSPGPQYYLCSIEGHCGMGQKLAINVLATASTSPTPATTSPPPAVIATPSGPPSSPASRLVATGLSVTFFSFAVALSF